VEGFGKLDAVGRVKPFGYVTIEATPAQLTRCRNVLNGSTWKGAKLRIGEAKPDFAERIAKEREEASEPPKKKPKLRHSKYSAIEAADMSLVTPENAATRPGWILTSTGRLLRPMRMRPERPLPQPISTATAVKKVQKFRQEKERASQTSTCPGAEAHHRYQALGRIDVPSQGMDSTEDESEIEVEPAPSPPRRPSPPRTIPVPLDETDLAKEKTQTLDLLSSIFGGKDDDWGGAESVDSDIEVDLANVVETNQDLDMDYEVVPAVDDTATKSTNKLKELFKPREDEGKFSLMDHLGLDFEMDDDEALLPFTQPIATDAPHPIPDDPQAMSVPIAVSFQSNILLDPKKPLFFPLASSFPSAPTAPKARTSDLFDVARERQWTTGLLSTGGYHRTTTEEIKGWWEENKGELTKGWKKRFREASKLKRRRGAGGGDDAE
ncbi:hypothetical protein BDZ89DRAFT_1213184, partial [Hymenopellis radicata]